MTDPTPTDRLREAVEILRQHNEWRRGAVIPQESPGMIGAAIDVVCELVPDLIKDRAFLLGQAKEAERIAGAVLAERDAARADAERLAEALADWCEHEADCALSRPGLFAKTCNCAQQYRVAALAAHEKAKERRT